MSILVLLLDDEFCLSYAKSISTFVGLLMIIIKLSDVFLKLILNIIKRNTCTWHIVWLCFRDSMLMPQWLIFMIIFVYIKHLIALVINWWYFRPSLMNLYEGASFFCHYWVVSLKILYWLLSCYINCLSCLIWNK